MRKHLKKVLLVVFILGAWIILSRHSVEIYPISQAYSSDKLILKPPLASSQIVNTNEDRQTLKFKKFSEKDLTTQFCILKKKYPHLNLSHNSEIQFNLDMNNNENIRSSFYIKESRCPADAYSIVKVDENGEIISYFDCETASKTELFVNTSFQYQLEKTVSDENQLNASLSGPGYFLVLCTGDHQFYVTRKGHFTYKDGLLSNEDGCFLSGSQEPILILEQPEQPDENGCFKKSKVCLGAVEPEQYNNLDFKFMDKEYTQFNYSKYDRRLKPVKSTKLVNNTSENRYDHFSTDTGLPDWSMADVVQPPMSCD